MTKEVIKEILSANTIDDIEKIEDEVLTIYRNNFYNELLQDEKIKNHLSKIFDVTPGALQNVLMINGCPPIDDFNEEEM